MQKRSLHAGTLDKVISKELAELPSKGCPVTFHASAPARRPLIDTKVKGPGSGAGREGSNAEEDAESVEVRSAPAVAEGGAEHEASEEVPQCAQPQPAQQAHFQAEPSRRRAANALWGEGTPAKRALAQYNGSCVRCCRVHMSAGPSLYYA